MKERLIVQVVGPSRAGKTEISKRAAEEHAFSTVLISDIIRAYADMRGSILRHRASYREAFQDMKATLGNSVIADTVLEAGGSRIWVDGNRSPADVDRLRRAAPGAVIALHCPDEERFRRAMALRSPLDRQTFDKFMADSRAESASQNREHVILSTVMDEADYHVDASQPLEQVWRDVNEIVIPLLG